MANNIKGKVIPIDELELPEVLYKYRSFNNIYHQRSLFEQEIYLPPASQFNDPFDSKVPFRYREEDLTLENVLKKCLDIARQTESNLSDQQYDEIAFRIKREGLLYDSHHLEQVDKKTFERLCSDFGIYCLTPDEKNLLMWSYYADSHKGFCIGYNTQLLIKQGVFGMGGQIAYRDDFPKLPLFISEDDSPLLNILFTKWKKWEHEDEYRLIHRYKNGNTRILEPSAISEVVLGCQVSEIDKIKHVEHIRQQLPDVKIFQIEQLKDKFGLTKVAVFDDKLFI